MRLEPALGLALALFTLGCTSPVTTAPAPAPAAPGFVGRVVRVNAAQRFVIVQCERLPSEGDTLTLYRGKEPAGRLRATGPFRPPYVAADVLEGAPERGDAVRAEARITAEPETSGSNL
ncbi:MAG TPA: hypothetical protein P5567_00135 [Kiritimatiellia bacterium]|nr:hypothetical protein [Kiritimatiellia bacterium]HRZ10844.1 hypothetical protein [Kiritimatiellia bacterium]HSA18883.1 hypothetical protein [Kiritimatiellia bacterium]